MRLTKKTTTMLNLKSKKLLLKQYLKKAMIKNKLRIRFQMKLTQADTNLIYSA